jgi:hypothetical protein
METILARPDVKSAEALRIAERFEQWVLPQGD